MTQKNFPKYNHVNFKVPLTWNSNKKNKKSLFTNLIIYEKYISENSANISLHFKPNANKIYKSNKKAISQIYRAVV